MREEVRTFEIEIKRDYFCTLDDYVYLQVVREKWQPSSAYWMYGEEHAKMVWYMAGKRTPPKPHVLTKRVMKVRTTVDHAEESPFVSAFRMEALEGPTTRVNEPLVIAYATHEAEITSAIYNHFCSEFLEEVIRRKR